MRKQIFSVMAVLIFSAVCTGFIVEMASARRVEAVDPSLLEQVNAHQQIISAMSEYFSKLQEKGILPKPDELAKLPKKEK